MREDKTPQSNSPAFSSAPAAFDPASHQEKLSILDYFKGLGAASAAIATLKSFLPLLVKDFNHLALYIGLFNAVEKTINESVTLLKAIYRASSKPMLLAQLKRIAVLLPESNVSGSSQSSAELSKIAVLIEHIKRSPLEQREFFIPKLQEILGEDNASAINYFLSAYPNHVENALKPVLESSLSMARLFIKNRKQGTTYDMENFELWRTQVDQQALGELMSLADAKPTSPSAHAGPR
ncbi:MAG: hypothetical protein NTZ67_03165 [Gammaproteobacteria bacterium]|nr:hypothetical protein [Gammaproteobacteria bacterium]